MTENIKMNYLFWFNKLYSVSFGVTFNLWRLRNYYLLQIIVEFKFAACTTNIFAEIKKTKYQKNGKFSVILVMFFKQFLIIIYSRRDMETEASHWRDNILRYMYLSSFLSVPKSETNRNGKTKNSLWLTPNWPLQPSTLGKASSHFYLKPFN